MSREGGSPTPIRLGAEEILARARSILANKNISYRLKYPNGGSDPRKATPGDLFKGEDGKLRLVCDCAGFVAWCCGYPRRLAGFPDTASVKGIVTGGVHSNWINTDSMIEESENGEFFKRLEKPVVGGIVVFHSNSKLYPKNPKMGHTGIISGVPVEVPPDREDWFNLISVIHCSGVDKKSGTAVRETTGKVWAGKQSYFLQWRGY